MNDTATKAAQRTDHRRGSAGEVFATFLKLGLTSFGGPIAHLGYFRDELVVRRRWIDEKGYADLVALCQFLPGPASSQTGFALGLLRGGPLGAAAAWAAFTLPSAILLVLFAFGAASFGGPLGSGVIHGLKVVAVAIVAQAVWGMASKLCPDRERASIALAAVLIVVLVPGSVGQLAAIVVGGVAGLLLCRRKGEAITGHVSFPVSHSVGWIALVLFFGMLFGLPIAAATTSSQGLAVFGAFYRAGALVFGGGHVVLPLLQAEVVQPGWVMADQFLAGYGAAQAVPGPLFTFAAYLGAALGPEPNGLIGAGIGVIAIFLPGFLLLIGTIPFWDAFRTRPAAQALMRGANAAVVGVLGAALYQPVWTSAIVGPHELALALICFVLLMSWKSPPWIVVVVSAVGGVLIGFA
ncbi:MULTISPECIES: chromate efflux transporter [Sinorhizobium]|uniref:Chromate transporter n=1 Tax=Sinorhizobium americanum TaxID=194963 RepID=A0A2S3YT46_9HYPH|nr:MULTISPECIES: chromate efflux transporter [Sinorhizobium]PDT36622.1 chromate transporter [Sinorhizobium sp. FG01]PDT49945.1 chromate transporter [Sinorhizobium sp. NG07B]POH33548.1 chromate transporter [Sinorhizobium americanum]POH34765.1 chromate transporter [Sinorhizobium americanum]